MRSVLLSVAAFLVMWGLAGPASAQEYCPPDRGAPGDAMIQAYLARETEKLEGGFLDGVTSLAGWEMLRPQYVDQYYYMLGLRPMPPKAPLNATVTGTLQRDGYSVELLHYQSRPRLYVTGNLYRPANIAPGQRLPAVFFPCGHSYQGRSGNKTAYQSHGIWFAKHGYICLVVDSLQLGEIAAIHHGTYREGRWWWHSRGYTPAGVECLNGIRGIDYLTSRPDVDPRRIAVTGISGGGAATSWISAADERVGAAVPVSGMADLRSYVTNRVINGHCDCMFLYNTYQWPWAKILAMVAPRPMLFTNSDHDTIFPMDANEREINRLKRVYSLYGASDMVECLVSMGGHAYRKDIRQGVFRFINLHLKGDPRIVTDSEQDLITGEQTKRYPIEPDKLRVFPTDSDLPKDELNTTIDRHFVPVAEVALPKPGEFDGWRKALQERLGQVTFRCFPERIAAARLTAQVSPEEARLESEPGIEVGLQHDAGAKPAAAPKRVLLVVRDAQTPPGGGAWAKRIREVGDETYYCSPRGVGRTRWTMKNPPNYVERCHALLGRTVDTGRIWDIIAAARYLRAKHEDKVPVYVLGEGAAGVLAAYAALWEPEIAGVIVRRPPLGHMDAASPVLLNVLRVCDIPDALGMLAPRPLVVEAAPCAAMDRVAAIYRAAGAEGKLVRKGD